jgi:RNA-binding protein PNO1
MADINDDLLMDDLPELVETNPVKAAAAKIAAQTTALAGVVSEESEFMVVSTKRGKRKRADNAMDTVSQAPTVASASSKSSKRKRLDTSNRETRVVGVPPNRFGPLKTNWLKIFTPIVKHLGLMIRFNIRARNIELRNGDDSDDIANLQKGADFVRAFIIGFEVDDALALVRLDDLFIESFEVTDVKPLKGVHVSRAIGRLAGKGGRTKFTIENVTKTRIVLADSKIHIMGSFQNCRVARNAICALIMGAPPSKVYGNLRSMASRSLERM